MVVRRPYTFVDRLYLPAIVRGLAVTIRHLFRKPFTRLYPEERYEKKPGHRGAHRLNKDAFGHVKCVACELCATACPAFCIHIVPAPAPPDWEGRERFPVKFEIDMLRCIFCGFCEEACPEDAIELTYIDDLSSYSREEMIWDKRKLLEMYDVTIARQPMKTAQHPDLAKVAREVA